MSSENVTAVREFIEMFNRGDLDALAAAATGDVELHEWPTAPGAQTYRGPDGVRQAFENWFESWEWMQLEIRDIVDAGDSVLFELHQRAKGRGSSAEVEITSHNVYSFRDGQVTRIQLFTERDPALAAAGLPHDNEEEKR